MPTRWPNGALHREEKPCQVTTDLKGCGYCCRMKRNLRHPPHQPQNNFQRHRLPPENDEQKNAKVKDGVQKRIDELTYRANQAQREKQIAEDYAKAVEANLPAKRELAQYQAYATAPRVDQFNSVEEWQAAVMRHATDTANHQVQSTLQQLGMTPEQQIQRAQQEQYKPIHAIACCGSYAEIPRFLGKGQQPTVARPDTRVNPAVLQALVASPNFADIAYHLASNPQEAWRINSITSGSSRSWSLAP